MKYAKPLFASKKDMKQVKALIEKHIEENEDLEIRAIGMQDFEVTLYGHEVTADGDIELDEEVDCAMCIDPVLIFCEKTETIYLDRRKEIGDEIMKWDLVGEDD